MKNVAENNPNVEKLISELNEVHENNLNGLITNDEYKNQVLSLIEKSTYLTISDLIEFRLQNS